LTGSDVERILAFHEIGRVDPIEYLQPWEVVVEQALAMEKSHQSEVAARTGSKNVDSNKTES